MIVFVGMLVVGLVLTAAGMVSEIRTLQGSGMLLAFVGLVGAMALGIRWLWYRGVG